MVLQGGNCLVHPILKIDILIACFLNFCLMLFLKIVSSSIQFLWFIFFSDFDNFCTEIVKINESRYNECTHLKFDFPNSKLVPESNSNLRSKMAQNSDMLPGEREKEKNI